MSTCCTSNITVLLLSAVYRQDDAKWQTAGIKFTHRPKIRFFAPQGRIVEPIHVKLGRADGRRGPLGCAKFHLNRHRGGNAAPKYQKFPLRGDSLDRFRKFLGAFFRPAIMHQRFKFDMIRFTGYGVITEKPRVGQLGRIFPCTL